MDYSVKFMELFVAFWNDKWPIKAKHYFKPLYGKEQFNLYTKEAIVIEELDVLLQFSKIVETRFFISTRSRRGILIRFNRDEFMEWFMIQEKKQPTNQVNLFQLIEEITGEPA